MWSPHSIHPFNLQNIHDNINLRLMYMLIGLHRDIYLDIGIDLEEFKITHKSPAAVQILAQFIQHDEKQHPVCEIL